MNNVIGGFEEGGARLAIEHNTAEHAQHVVVTVRDYQQHHSYIIIPDEVAAALFASAAGKIRRRVTRARKERGERNGLI